MKQNRLKLMLAFLLASPLTQPQNLAQDAFVPGRAPTIGSSNTGLFSASDLAGIEAEKALQGKLSEPGNRMTSDSNPLVISTEPLSNDIIAGLEEDMKIMASLLSETTGTSEEAAWASGIPLINYTKNKTNRDIYISGTGALFFLKVDFPLIGKTAKERIVEASPKDSAWERARRKVQGRTPRRYMGTERMFQAYEMAHPIRPKPFNPEKVRVFKTALTEALGSASNIRALEPTEQVWIVVEGPGELYRNSPPPSSAYVVPDPQSTHSPSFISRPDQFTYPGQATPLPLTKQKKTRLTISATKKDIDDVHDGTISMKEFLKRIKQQSQ